MRRATRVTVEGVNERALSLDAAIRLAKAELSAPDDCITIDVRVEREEHTAYPWKWSVTFAIPVRIL